MGLLNAPVCMPLNVLLICVVYWAMQWLVLLLLLLQVERNIQKVSDAYETLAQHSQKRENLEKLMRLKLDSEISRLTEVNQQVQGD